jgi:hypothetical protein
MYESRNINLYETTGTCFEDQEMTDSEARMNKPNSSLGFHANMVKITQQNCHSSKDQNPLASFNCLFGNGNEGLVPLASSIQSTTENVVPKGKGPQG